MKTKHLHTHTHTHTHTQSGRAKSKFTILTSFTHPYLLLTFSLTDSVRQLSLLVPFWVRWHFKEPGRRWFHLPWLPGMSGLTQHTQNLCFIIFPCFFCNCFSCRCRFWDLWSWCWCCCRCFWIKKNQGRDSEEEEEERARCVFFVNRTFCYDKKENCPNSLFLSFAQCTVF